MTRNERRRAAAPSRGTAPLDALADVADAAVRGERGAVRALLVSIGPHLLDVIRRVLGAEHSEVDGVLQESAFAVIDTLPRRRRECTVLRFVGRIALLTAIQRRRPEAARRPDTVATPEPTGAALVLSRLDSLPLPQAELLALEWVLGYAPPEIAESADISLEIVRERLREADGALRELLVEPERVLQDARLAFEAPTPVQPGDEERIQRTVERVLKTKRALRFSPRELLAFQSGGLALLIAGIAVAGIGVARWHPHAQNPSTAASTRATPSLSHDQRLVPVTPEPASSEAPPKIQPAPSASTPSPAPIESKYRSASELFADANAARVAGDAPKAIAISELLEQTFPNSTEGITTHLSLGVLYLQQGRPNRALGEFKIYRHIGATAMMAEALWGEKQALEQLGRVSEERAVLEELLTNYPHSAYVGAAEKRLAALNN